jgi:hypothetical protein
MEQEKMGAKMDEGKKEKECKRLVSGWVEGGSRGAGGDSEEERARGG